MQMKQRRVVAWLTLAVFCLILLPFMKHSWLDRNQANPNYYFAYSGLHSCLCSWLYSGERNDPKYRPRVLFFSVSFDFFLFLLLLLECIVAPSYSDEFGKSTAFFTMAF